MLAHLDLAQLLEDFFLICQDLVLKRNSLIIGYQDPNLLGQDPPMIYHHPRHFSCQSIPSDVSLLSCPTQDFRSTMTRLEAIWIGVGS